MKGQDFVTVTSCPICASQALRLLHTRSDGIAVLQCERCKMGFVERYPTDLSTYYEDVYFYASQTATDTGIGYTDYDAVTAHSLSWVIYLIRMLRSRGRVLDVGCADGYLLKQLGEDFSLHGIEANRAMVQACQAAGIRVIGQDINDQQLIKTYGASFDIVTSLAVLEHIPDLRKALCQIKALLAAGGIFIFEVPLISDSQDNTVWYTSSLEHIYYPTVAGLRYVMEDVFGLPLVGGECWIHQYGSTFIGLVSIDEQTHSELSRLYTQLFETPSASLQSQPEKTFRFLYDFIHAATISQDSLALLPQIDPAILTPALLKRISTLVAELEQGKIWLERQNLNWQRTVEKQAAELEEMRAWIAELEQGKAWLEEQGRNWQRLAEEREAQLNQIDEFLTRSRLKSLIRLGSRLGVLRQGLAEKTLLD